MSWRRRDLLAAAPAILAARQLWGASPDAAPPASRIPADAGQRSLLERLCDLIIPDTDTPGARRAGVPDFLLLALSHGLTDTSPADLEQVRLALEAASTGPFLALEASRQAAVLAEVDAHAYAQRGSSWAKLKYLVILGYYTSEIGAAQELQYSLVPGRYDPDLPVKPGERAWSSDWVGQSF